MFSDSHAVGMMGLSWHCSLVLAAGISSFQDQGRTLHSPQKQSNSSFPEQANTSHYRTDTSMGSIGQNGIVIFPICTSFLALSLF